MNLNFILKVLKTVLSGRGAWGRWHWAPPSSGTLLAVARQSENKAMKCKGQRGTSCDPAGQ